MKQKTDNSSNRILAFGTLFLAVFALVIGFVIGQVVPQIAPATNKSQEENIDSVKLENVALRQALTAKMESFCDTMTVDQKLAQQKLDEYSSKMNEVKDAQELKAYEIKQESEMKAYEVKQNKELNSIWQNYWKNHAKAISEMEKTDPRIFAEYALIVFKHDNCDPDNIEVSQSLWERLKRIEKNPVVANYLSSDNNAFAIKTRLESENEKNCSTKLAEIEKNYQAKLVIIEQNYKQKIAAKAVELGL